jgi:hypothetical protein
MPLQSPKAEWFNVVKGTYEKEKMFEIYGITSFAIIINL